MRFVTPARSRRLLTRSAVVLATLAASLVGTLVGMVATTTPAQASSYIVLSPGAHGAKVVQLQRYLHVRATGSYGRATRAAVVRWQAAHHRHRTGRVGRLLWNAVLGRRPSSSRAGDRVTSLNWRALARCESGGNPRAVNPSGYYGLYQFSPGTWRSVGGHGMPHRASPGEQTRRAQVLFRRAGASPWPHCGRHLFS